MLKHLAIATAVLFLPTATLADDILEAMDAARAAYEAGDITTAMEELNFATGLLQAKRADGLSAFLPDAPEGWTREVSTEMSGAMAVIGGGTGTEATYSGDGQMFSISLMADSPMIMAMAPMLSNPMLASASGAKLHRIGSIKALEMDGTLAALVANRFLIQAEGAETKVMMPLFEQIDFDGIASFNP